MAINRKKLRKNRLRRTKSKEKVKQQYIPLCCHENMSCYATIIDEVGNSFWNIQYKYRGTAQRQEYFICTKCKRQQLIGISKGHPYYG